MRALAFAAVLVSGPAFAQPGFHPTPPPEPPPLHPVVRLHQVWLGFSMGSGLGVIGGKTEGLEADVETGPQWAPMQLRAELAAFRNPQLAFALNARLGFPIDTDTDAPSAKAIMLRVYRMCLPDRGLRYHGAIGAGYIRYRVGVDGTTKDTMAAGPLLIGGGAGYVLPISKSWRLTIDVSAIGAIASSDRYGGVPNEHALHFDLDLGLAVFR